MFSKAFGLGVAAATLGVMTGCTSMAPGIEQPTMDPPPMRNPERTPDFPQSPQDLDNRVAELLRAIGLISDSVPDFDRWFLKCGCVGDVTTSTISLADCDQPDSPCDVRQIPKAKVQRGMQILEMVIDARLQGREVRIDGAGSR